ncbi:exodeoxyribonuclease VII large subunit [Parahaliea aestuarii]|uniref:Exodeoxyribonuclease 7 large subunit n=1 Tax=Parahaliea aestuarii TaxID=1852021 RepID=A0A5C8ZT76_9GAMM|nr:exodeoxyribonuclease VII large subunit [Parahaliea aestuarii]TXS91656.1 exodeoxyribonuclease VII large subunit [Parahaliea aestuarii]
MTTQSAPPTLTVSQLNSQVRRLLESSFDFLWVEGEISNFAAPSSGHWYFSLKDAGAQVRCAMFRNRNQRLRLQPKNGDHIRLRCRVSLYEGRGEFQLIAEFMEPAGAGALQAAFEQLKAKLLAEGLFAPERKRPLPDHIHHLGIITSPTGAAIHDILTVLERRWPAMQIHLLPVAVQGDAAAGEIAAAIGRANRLAASGEVPLDALIVGRGGGSLEDLWAFNEEVVARAIVASALPVVSAVGHEVDFTIADMAADVRAATPSAAAELVSPNREEWLARLQQLEGRLERAMARRLAEMRSQLEHLRKRLRHPGQQLREQAQRLDELEQRLIRAQHHALQRRGAELALMESRLLARSPLPRVRQLQQQLGTTEKRMENAVRNRLQRAREQLGQLAQLLDSVSPLATLGRGYSVLTSEAGKVIRDAADVDIGQTLSGRLARGRLALRVEGKVEDETESRSNTDKGNDNKHRSQ